MHHTTGCVGCVDDDLANLQGYRPDERIASDFSNKISDSVGRRGGPRRERDGCQECVSARLVVTGERRRARLGRVAFLISRRLERLRTVVSWVTVGIISALLLCGCTSTSTSSVTQGLSTKPTLVEAESLPSESQTGRLSSRSGSAGTLLTTGQESAPSKNVYSTEPTDKSERSATDESGPSKTFLGTQREYIDAFTDCLRSKGFQSHVAEDGTITYPGVVGDTGGLGVAQAGCVKEIGVIQTRDFTTEQLKAYYVIQLAQWKCLKDSGFAVAPAQTWQTYVDTANRAGAPSWDVFAGLTSDQIGDGLARCPNKVAG